MGKSIFVSMPKNLVWTTATGGPNVTITSQFVVYRRSSREEIETPVSPLPSCLLRFFCLKNDVNVASKSNKQKKNFS